MAVAYRSHASTNIVSKDGAAWSVIITKPAGLTAGDYMVAVIGTSSNESAQTVTGWTLLANQQKGVDERILVYGKTADSSDASATDFTFAVHSGNGGSGDGMGGCLIAFSGDAPVSAVSFVDTGTSTGTAQTYTGGITPPSASLLVFGTWGRGSIATTVASYAITTDNGTWTERMDDTEAVSTEDYVLAVATSPRTATTATGNFTCTYSNSMDTVGVLLAVVESQSTTQTPAVITATATVQAPTVSAGANISTTVITSTASVQAPTVSFPVDDWINQSKNSTSWTNETKN